jgi:hypothetical protein
MQSPRGYNPVGDCAPGRHDAPLPGHVAGQYTPIGHSDDRSPSVSSKIGDAGRVSEFYRNSGYRSHERQRRLFECNGQSRPPTLRYRCRAGNPTNRDPDCPLAQASRLEMDL